MNKIELLIGGKSHPVKLGLRFLENVTTSEGITIVDVFTKSSACGCCPQTSRSGCLFTKETIGRCSDL